MSLELDDLFGQYFEVVHANTEALKDKVFWLRYQVYCLETGFEDKSQFADGRERDRFDELAQHALVTHRGTDMAVATVRLVGADLSHHDAVFPLEQAHPGLLATRGFGPDRLPWTTTAEISRFAISREFKRRVGEPGTLAGVSEVNAGADMSGYRAGDRRMEPFIIMGLFKAIFRLSIEHGYTHWVAAMEPALLRLLLRFGIRFTSIGAPIIFHGRRQPCVGSLHDIYEGVHRSRPDVWNFVTEQGQLRSPILDRSYDAIQGGKVLAAG